jgi:NTE family protein
MIDLLGKLIDQGHLTTGPDFHPVNLHRIVLDGGPHLTSESQLNNEDEFFKMLHRAGQCAAQQFLESHFDDIGVRGTLAAEQAAA